MNFACFQLAADVLSHLRMRRAVSSAARAKTVEVTDVDAEHMRIFAEQVSREKTLRGGRL